MRRKLLPTNHSTLVLILTITISHPGGHKSHPVILTAITLHCQTQQMYSAGTHEVEGKEPYYMGIDFMEKKPDQWKVEKPERDGKITGKGLENWVFDIFISVYNYYYNSKGEEGPYYPTCMCPHNKP